MRKSIRSLLAESIDYAGVFPPARLSLNHALENYVRYLDDPQAWLMARFACPAGRLLELDPPAKVFKDVRPTQRATGRFAHRVAVVADVSENAKQFRDDLLHDVRNIVEFDKTHSNYAKVDALELKLPADMDTSSSGPVVDLLNSVCHQLDMAELNPINVIVELRPQQRPEGVLTMLDALETIRDDRCCLKIRTGGLPRDDMPSADQLAFFIDACRTSRVRWKATAGLHAPLSRYDDEDQLWHFGFVNVFAAAVFASKRRITQEHMKLILTENSGDAFNFSDTLISWRDHELTIPEIEEGRAHSILSFGSCSFEKPRDGLRELMLRT